MEIRYQLGPGSGALIVFIAEARFGWVLREHGGVAVMVAFVERVRARSPCDRNGGRPSPDRWSSSGGAGTKGSGRGRPCSCLRRSSCLRRVQTLTGTITTAWSRVGAWRVPEHVRHADGVGLHRPETLPVRCWVSLQRSTIRAAPPPLQCAGFGRIIRMALLAVIVLAWYFAPLRSRASLREDGSRWRRSRRGRAA
jgi:hypothetical protein